MRRRRVVVAVVGGEDEVSSSGGANRPRAATAVAAGRFGPRNRRWPELRDDPCSSGGKGNYVSIPRKHLPHPRRAKAPIFEEGHIGLGCASITA